MDTSFKVNRTGNEAILKYRAAEPLTIEDLLVIGGVDTDIWIVDKHRINAWQMGRSKKKVDLSWEDGAQSGYVQDDGTIHKEYLYQIEVKLTRRERVPVLPTLQPVEIINNIEFKKIRKSEGADVKRVIFVTDPHFGFSTPQFETPRPFHHRRFLSDLMCVAVSVRPDYVVWGGDILDLAEFSKYPKRPDLIQKTQIAAVEAAWVINQFGELVTKGQVVIEGNHDARLGAAVAQNLSAAYELRPVHDLGGESLLSLPRLLGIDQRDDIQWIGDYPNGYFELGDVRFEHGNKVSSPSGGTVGALMKSREYSTFFGHIHRHEIGSRRREDGTLQVIGCPGCACHVELVPGADRFVTWSTGAFLLSFDKGRLIQVEDIQHRYGKTYFRGAEYLGPAYHEVMKKQLPKTMSWLL